MNVGKRAFLWAMTVAATFALPCGAETPIYLDSYVENDRFYISLTGLAFCSASQPGRLIALVDSKDGHFEQIACYEYAGPKIKVYLYREDLEFDASEEKYEYRESLCPDCRRDAPIETTEG